MGEDRSRRIRKHDLVWELSTEEADDVPLSVRREKRLRAVAQQVVQLASENRLAVPMLPQAATEALRLANDPSASIREIEAVVSADPLIAARVLAVANSSMYGSQNVRSLARALQRLGTGTIRDILYQAVAEAHIFRGSAGEALKRERDHAVGVAHATRLICRQIGLDSGYAFVCGLLHDIGRPVLFDLFQSSRSPLPEDEQVIVVHRLHAFLGAHLANHWGLPKLALEACRRHHVYRDWGGKENYSQIGNVVAVADRMAYHHGLGRPVTPADLERDRSYYDLGLDPDRVQALLDQLGENRSGPSRTSPAHA